MRLINEIASKTPNGKTPKVFIILSHKAKIRFETLSLVDNRTYIRACHGTIKAPSTPEDLKLVFKDIPKIISWRDALVDDAASLHNNDDSACSSQDPDSTYDTCSVSSSQ
jgi:hypothetical protein